MLTNVEYYIRGMIIQTIRNVPNDARYYNKYAKHTRLKTYGINGFFPKGTQFMVSNGIDEDGDLQVHLIVNGKSVPNGGGKGNNYFIASENFKDYELV